LPRCVHPAPITDRLVRAVCLFSRATYTLDAFRYYLLWLSYSAMPCRTTDPPAATEGCSFRTYPSFPSGNNTSSRYRPNWLTPF